MENAFGWQARERSIPDNTWHDMTWHDITHTYIYIYLDLRKDTNDCPFARFLPLGRISCKGAGNGHFLTTVANFGFRTFWADITLLCVKMCRFFWAEIPGKRAKIPGQIHHDSKMKTWSGKFFSWNCSFYFDMDKSTENGQKSNQNLPWKEICNQWISRYIIIDWGLC